jgi:hypothetical protein
LSGWTNTPRLITKSDLNWSMPRRECSSLIRYQSIFTKYTKQLRKISFKSSLRTNPNFYILFQSLTNDRVTKVTEIIFNCSLRAIPNLSHFLFQVSTPHLIVFTQSVSQPYNISQSRMELEGRPTETTIPPKHFFFILVWYYIICLI